jgi:hypothetical protein
MIDLTCFTAAGLELFAHNAQDYTTPWIFYFGNNSSNGDQKQQNT